MNEQQKPTSALNEQSLFNNSKKFSLRTVEYSAFEMSWKSVALKCHSQVKSSQAKN